jgi:Tol biopolymer transport system component
MLLAIFVAFMCCSEKSNPVDTGADFIRVSAAEMVARNGAHPDWSPDQGCIAYSFFMGSGTNIFTISCVDSVIRQITNEETYNNHPFWSPDGNQIGFSSDRGGNQRYNIFAADIQSGEITRLTPDSIGVQSGDWSSDGESVVFDGTSRSLNHAAISIKKLTTNVLISLHPDLDYAGWPKFSPVDDRIVFEALANNSVDYNIWTIISDGTGLKQITTTGGEYPCWSPDGLWIAYSNKLEGNYDLFMIKSDGSGSPVQVTNTQSANEVRASWAPGGDAIAYDTMMGTDTVDPQNAGVYVLTIEFL